MSANKKLSPSRLCDRLLFRLGLGFLLLWIPCSSRAGTLEDAVRALARRVAFSARGISWSCKFQNHSSLPGPLFAALSAAFQDELQRQGIPQNKSTASVVLSVSQNLTQYLGIAWILNGDSSQTLIAPLAFVEGSASAEPGSVFSLRKELLFYQDKPILDVVFEPDGQRAHVLGPREISDYELQDGRWTLKGNEQLRLPPATAREQGGFLSLGIASRTVYSPGKVCTLDANDWRCENYEGPMPIRSVAPELISKKKTGPWMAAAQLGRDANAMLVLTGEDSRAHLYEDGADPVAFFSGWGSEIASLSSGCGSGWQLLVTGKGDWTRSDEIHAVEIENRVARSVSPLLELPGPVMRMLTPGDSSAVYPVGKSSAIAIVRNLNTGSYEIYRLTMACGG